MNSEPRSTIFLFDDVISVLRRQKAQLQHAGYSVRAFSNAFLFVEAVQTGTLEHIPDIDAESGLAPDMFVIDIAVGHDYAFPLDQTSNGETEGIGIANVVRRESKYHAVPIILISGCGEPQVNTNGRAAAKGMDPDKRRDSIFVQRKHCTSEKLPPLVNSYFANRRRFPSLPFTWHLELTVPFGFGKFVVGPNH